ncbi:MAG: radical SAM protein [Desulfobacteraceae bacterium]|nr:MAG: radical SAM protein [Desulfobacteraceae bacterium]
MKVLLVSANTHKEPYPVYPLGLDYVAGSICEAHEVRIADMNEPGGVESLVGKIREFSPDVIGLSLRNIDNTDVENPMGFMGPYRELTRIIRGHSDGLLVLGGSAFTIHPGPFMNELKADYGILGEGERLSLLLDAIQNREDAAEIPGVVLPGLLKPLPGAWENGFPRDFRKERFHVEFYLKRGGMLNLQTKRGCGYSCIYCTYPSIEGRTRRFVSPESVVETALRLQAAGARYFFITDSVFNSDFEHNIAVAEAFRKAGVSVPWGGYFMPIDAPPDYFRLMAEAGLTHVEFGTESLCDTVLASYRKPFKANEVFSAHQGAVDAGLHVAHFFLLGGPGESGSTLDETLKGAERLTNSALFFFCGMRIYPNTKLFDLAVEEGQISETADLLEPVFYRPPHIDPGEILRRVKSRGKGRINWVTGTGGRRIANTMERMYQRGHSGPLWEHLIR